MSYSITWDLESIFPGGTQSKALQEKNYRDEDAC